MRRPLLALKLVLALVASLLTVVVAAEPAAAATCTGGATYSPTGYNVTVTPLHGRIFYVDFKNGINAAYVGFQVSNNNNVAIGDAWVKLSGFGSNVKLANDADDTMQIGSVAAKSGSTPGTGVAFFYLKATAVAASTQSFTVTLYNGRPDNAASVNIGNCSNDFARVDQVIAANSNKVTSITVNTTTPQLGDALVVTVNGITGTGGAGDATGDADVMWLSPASAATWPTRALRLESTDICVKKNSNSCVSQSSGSNILLVTGINQSGNTKFTSKTTYTATYTFRVMGSASFDPTVSPVAQIASGTQMKHTGSYPSTPSAIQLTKVNTASFVITKNASTTLVSSAFCNTTRGKAAVRYTITATLQSPATSGQIDEIVDTPLNTAELDTTNSNVTVTDVNNTGGATWPTSKAFKETVGTDIKYHFVGPFKASSTRTVTISYTMCIPWSSTATNSGYGLIGPTVVGYNSTQICAANVQVGASGSSTGTVSTSCTTSKPKQTQTITFDPLNSMGVGDQQTLIASTNSGNPVTFSTTTTSKCTVSQSGSTWSVTAVATTDVSNPCTVTANAAGDADYSAAAPVSRNATILSGQTIVLTPSSLSNMNISTTQDFNAKSVKTSDTSTLTGLTVTVTSLTSTTCTVGSLGSNNFRITATTTVGTCYLVVSQAGGTSGGITYAAATNVEPSLIVGSPQSIDFPQPADQASTTSPGTTFSISATSKKPDGTVTNLLIDFATSTPDICTVGTESIASGVTSVTVTKVAAGQCTISASQVGDSVYSPATDVIRTLNIGSPQTITFSALSDVVYTSSTKSISASTNSSLQITFTSSNTSYCTVGSASLSGNITSATVTRVAQGSCTITASQAGNASWWAATSVVQTFTFLGSTSQTITFAQPTTPTNISGSVFAAPATADSKLPVRYSSGDTNTCTVADDGTVTMLKIGNCVINTDQEGNSTYAAAARVTRTVVIQATPSIGFSTSDKTITDGTTSLTYTHTYSVPSTGGTVDTGLTVSFDSTTKTVCTVSGVTVTFLTTGTCTITASQAGSGNVLASAGVTSSFTIRAATQAITFATPTNVTYVSGGSRSITASTNSKLLISFSPSNTDVCTVGTGSVDASGVTTITVAYVGAGNCQLTASQAGNGTYSAAVNVIRSFTINPASQSINFGAINAQTYGDTIDVAGQASATSGLSVSYGVSGGCTLLGTVVTITTGGGTCSVTASQGGNANYNAATPVTVSFATNKRGIVVTAQAASKKPGDPDPTFDYTYTGVLKFSDKFVGSLTRDNPGVNTAGTYGIRKGTLDINSNYDITFNSADLTITDKTVPSLTWADPSAIEYGTAISNATHLNATASVAGSKTYTYKKAGVDTAVADGDKLEAGTYTFTVSFAPTDNANYAPNSKSVTVVVNKKTVSTVVSVTSREYDGSAAFTSLSFTSLSGVVAGDESGVAIDTGNFSVTTSSADVGTYAGTSVVVPSDHTGLTGAKSGNYVISYNSTLTAQITAKALTLSISSTSKEYDGSNSAPISYSLNGKIGSDDVSIDTANLSAVFDDANYGASKTITITKTSGNGLTGGKAGNYSVTIPASVSGGITKKPVTATAAAASKEYDGSTDAVLTVSGLTGVLAGDSSDVSADTGNIAGTFASADVGTRTVTVAAKAGRSGLSGSKSGNYSLSSSTTSAEITARQITLTVDDQTITAGDATPSFSWTVTKSGGATPFALPGHTISAISKSFISSDSSRSSSAPTTAGTYTIEPSAASFAGGANSGNYQVNYVNGTFRINPSTKTPQVVTIDDPGSITYGAAPLSLTYRADSGKAVTVAAVSGNCTWDAGTGKLTITGAGQCEIKGDASGDSTYDPGTTTRYITVNKKTISFAGLSALNKEYDGTTSATLTGTATTSERVSGDGSSEVDLDTTTAAFGSAAAGDGKSVSVSSYTLKGSKKDFYQATFGSMTANITKRTLTVTATVANKEYDGTSTATPTYGSLARKISGDDVSLKTSDFTVAFSDADAGDGKTVSFIRGGGLSGLQGAAKDNYQLDSISIATANITPRQVTLTLDTKTITEGESTSTFTWTLSRSDAASALIGTDEIASVTKTFKSGATTLGATPTTAGTYTVVPSAVSFTSGKGDLGNYSFTFINGTFTIRAKDNTPPDPEPQKPEVVKEKTNASAQTKVDTPVQVEVKGVEPGAKVVLTDEVKNVPKDVKIDVDPKTGKLEVTPSNNWTGKFTVLVLTEKDSKQVEIETLVVVNPSEPEKAKSDVKALRETVVSWAAAPGAIRYDVTMDGKQVCSTSATSCKVNDIVGPKTKIDVTAIGNDDTKSDPKASPYQAEKPFTVETLPFAVNKAILTPVSKKVLDVLIPIIKEKGFTKMVIDGHTDSTNPKVNAKLSVDRAKAVVAYLKSALPDIQFSITGYAATQPRATNKTTTGKALNRRAEIKLW